MKKLVSGVLLSVVSVSAFANTTNAKTLADEKATFELCKSMAKAINTETMDFQPVTDIANPYWKYGNLDPNRSLASVGHQSNQVARFGLHLWGKPLNVVFAKTDKDKLGYFARHNFMLLRENIALDFYCDFYKGKDGWGLIGVRWNDNYHSFFE